MLIVREKRYYLIQETQEEESCVCSMRLWSIIM